MANFGDLYVNEHSYSSPDVVRIIGYTPKRVIVSSVPTIRNAIGAVHDEYRIDTDWLKNNIIAGQLTKRTSDDQQLMAFKDGYLIFKGRSYHRVNDLQKIFLVCEY